MNSNRARYTLSSSVSRKGYGFSRKTTSTPSKDPDGSLEAARSILNEIKNLGDSIQQECLAEMRLVGRRLQDDIRNEFRILRSSISGSIGDQPQILKASISASARDQSPWDHGSGAMLDVEHSGKGGHLRSAAYQPSTVPQQSSWGRVGNLDIRPTSGKGKKFPKKVHGLPEHDIDVLEASAPEGEPPSMMLNTPMDDTVIGLPKAPGTSGASSSGGTPRSAEGAETFKDNNQADEAAGGFKIKSKGHSRLLGTSGITDVKGDSHPRQSASSVLELDDEELQSLDEVSAGKRKASNRRVDLHPRLSASSILELDDEELRSLDEVPAGKRKGSNRKGDLHPRQSTMTAKEEELRSLDDVPAGKRKGSKEPGDNDLSRLVDRSLPLENAARGRLSITREIAKTAAKKTKVKPLWEMTLEEAIKSSTFDNVVGFVILLNAAVIGLQTNWNAQNLTSDVPTTFFVFEQLFAVWFTSELAIRLFVFRCSFFRPCVEGWLWNYFDFFIVFAQLLELFFELVARSAKIDVSNFRLLRVMRILRLVRILRVVRVLHLISELRAIVSSIAGSFRSLVWVVVLLFLMIYIVAVYFVQSITDHLVESKEDEGATWAPSSEEEVLMTYFGSLLRAILSLWQAMSGGLDWDTLAAPLLNQISLLTGVAFAAYIAFALLALMNVVTGVFVQTALQSAREEEDSFLTSQIIQLFEFADKDNSATVSLDEISISLEDPDYAKEWKSAGVDAEDARYLFKLLDLDETGEVAFEEFLGGCLRLKGGAKSIDLLTVMQEGRKNQESTRQALDSIQFAIEQVERLQIKSEERIMRHTHNHSEQLAFDVASLKA